MEKNHSREVTNFSGKEYWEDQYQQCNKLYEWYQPWSLFRPHVGHLIRDCDRMLNLGSGNSPMSYDMLSDGVQHIYNVDISPTVTEQMRERYASDSRLEWFTMDACQLSFENDMFDVVIEKGTIDALSCNSSANDLISQLLHEAMRVLKPGGVFISISFGAPGVRSGHLKACKWRVNEVIKVPKLFVPDNFYYVYSAVKD